MAYAPYPDELRFEDLLERVDRLGLRVVQDEPRPRYWLDIVEGTAPVIPFEPSRWPMPLDHLEALVTTLEADVFICTCLPWTH